MALTPLTSALLAIIEERKTAASDRQCPPHNAKLAGIHMPMYNRQGVLEELPVSTLELDRPSGSSPPKLTLKSPHHRPFTDLASLAAALGSSSIRKEPASLTHQWITVGPAGLVAQAITDTQNRVLQLHCTFYPRPVYSLAKQHTHPNTPVPSHTADNVRNQLSTGFSADSHNHQSSYRWVRPHERVKVAGIEMSGGIYQGTNMPAVNPHFGTEPALINPSLPVNFRAPDWPGDHLGYWPSYTAIPASSRAALLSWLASSRDAPRTPIGYVQLYYYGLERRVLVDGLDETQSVELEWVEAELTRLIDIYHVHLGFARTAQSLLTIVTHQLNGPTPTYSSPPAGAYHHRWEFPIPLAIVLAKAAVQNEPLSAELALDWVLSDPAVNLRKPATRDPQAFGRLFKTRYSTQYGQGLTIRPPRQTLRLPYYPASPGFRGHSISVPTKLPDIRNLTSITTELFAMADQVTEALEPHSRYLARHPKDNHSLAAEALLPPELVCESSNPVIKKLRNWLTGVLDGGQPTQGTFHEAVVTSVELLNHWPQPNPAKSELRQLYSLIGKLGAGIVPDPQHGGLYPVGPLTRSVVIFKTTTPPPPPIPQLNAAVLHLAAAVITSAPGIAAHLSEYTELLHTQLGLPGTHRSRTHALLVWASVTQSELAIVPKDPDAPTHVTPSRLTPSHLISGQLRAGIKRALVGTDQEFREHVGKVLVHLTTHLTSTPSPRQVESLDIAWTLLALAPSELYSQIHNSAESPVMVRPPTVLAGSLPIAPPPPGLVLDQTLIKAKQHQTRQARNMLEEIYAAADRDPSFDAQTAHSVELTSNMPMEAQAVNASMSPPQTQTPTPPANKGSALIDKSQPTQHAGLTNAHFAMLLILTTSADWSIEQLTAAATQVGLYPSGAMEVLNDASYEVSGEPLLEPDSDNPSNFQINHFALKELLP